MIEKQKRVKISTETKLFIAEKALAIPRGPRTALATELQRDMEKRKLPVPQLEVIERMISRCRNHAEDSPQEKPWSLATLKDFPISAAALPFVLIEFKRRVDGGAVLSIRQAKWAAQLSATGLAGLGDVISKTEQIYEILGQQPNFEIFDRLLAGLPGESDNWQVAFIALCSEAGVLGPAPSKIKRKRASK